MHHRKKCYQNKDLTRRGKEQETKKKKKEFEEIMYVPAGLSIEEFSTLAGGVQQFHVQFHQCEKESVMPHLSRQRLPSLGL